MTLEELASAIDKVIELQTELTTLKEKNERLKSESESDGCTCHRCKKLYTLDVSVSDTVWVSIYTENKDKAAAGGGLLCPQCIVDRLQSRVAEADALREALETMVEMVEMNGFGRAYAMDLARAALAQGQEEA